MRVFAFVEPCSMSCAGSIESLVPFDKARKVAKVMRELGNAKGRHPATQKWRKPWKISVDEFQELEKSNPRLSFVSTPRNSQTQMRPIRIISVADEKQVHPAEAAMANEMAHLTASRQVA
jgi:hypothetical protein